MQQRTMGIDLGVQSPNVAVVLDEQGEVLIERLWFELSTEEFEQVERAALRGAAEGTRLHVVMEKTFPTYEYVSKYFLSCGHEVSYAKPDQVKEGRKFLWRKVKTDVRDALVMARLPFLDPRQLNRMHVPKPALRELKTLVSQRLALVKHLTFLKNQLNHCVNALWPGLIAKLGCLDSSYARALVRELEPERVVELGESGMRAFLGERARTRRGQVQKLASGLVELAKRAVGLRGVLDDDNWVWLHRTHTLELLEQIESLERMLASKNRQIDQVYMKADPNQHFKTVPGVAHTTAPTFFSYFGEPERFGCTRKAQGFVGFYPATEDSGQSERKGTALSKEGPGLLRRDLFLASDHFRRVDPDGARVYYDQMVNKGKHHTSAVCVVANRVLLPRLVALAREQRPYQLRDFEGHPISKEQARKLAAQFRVPEEVRIRLRSRKKQATNKNRGGASPPVTSELEAPRRGTAPRQEDPSKERVTLTKAQLAMIVYRSLERLLNSGGNGEDIRSVLFTEAKEYFEIRP